MKIKSIYKEKNEVLHESELLLEDFNEIILGDKKVKNLDIEKETTIKKDGTEYKKIVIRSVDL